MESQRANPVLSCEPAPCCPMLCDPPTSVSMRSRPGAPIVAGQLARALNALVLLEAEDALHGLVEAHLTKRGREMRRSDAHVTGP